MMLIYEPPILLYVYGRKKFIVCFAILSLYFAGVKMSLLLIEIMSN